jgi:hypothetical protein
MYCYLKQKCHLFYKNEEQESRTGPVWGLVPVEGVGCRDGVGCGDGIERWIQDKYCVHMYVNERMWPVETIPGMEEGEIKENDGGVNLTMIYWKNFCKCLMDPQDNKIII